MVIGSTILQSLRFDNSKAPIRLPSDLQEQLLKLMDNLVDEGFFSHGFKTYMTANLYFKIPSGLSRGNWELLCLSVITRSRKPELFKDTLEAGVARLKAIPEVYKAFHGEQQVGSEDFKEKQQELKEFMASLCEDLRQAKKQASAKEYARERKRNQTRDIGRDETRDIGRDETRDVGRDENRDVGRDENRDDGRDETRDDSRDDPRDKDRDDSRDETRDESRDAGRDIDRDETRDVGRDETRDIGRDETRDVARDETREEGRDETRDKGRDESRDEPRDETRDAGRDIDRDETRDID